MITSSKDDFEKWLLVKNDSKMKTLSTSSAYKYSRAINSISKDMLENGVINKSLYNVVSSTECNKLVNEIKNSTFFIEKNYTGHNMYSVALDHYLNFLREN